MSLLGFLGGTKKADIPAFGGDVRPPIKGPRRIQRDLAFLSVVRTILTTAILVIGVVVLGLAFRTPYIMTTELFVSDGSALGCHVEAHAVEGR